MWNSPHSAEVRARPRVQGRKLMFHISRSLCSAVAIGDNSLSEQEAVLPRGNCPSSGVPALGGSCHVRGTEEATEEAARPPQL